VLIKRAREIIARSEEDIKVYHGKGLKHLTQAMEEEIERVRELERELIKLDQAKHIDPAKVLEYETRLLQHENRLLAEALKVEDAIRAEEQGKLPEELIKAAEILIKATEEFIAKHKLQGHLVDAIEAELKVLHGLAQELQALEKGKHVPPKVVFEYELRLLTHENKLVTEELILDHQHHLLPKKLPEALIHRAQAIIRKAEYDLERHRKAGHLVFRMEEEIHKVRALEKELLLLEKAKHVDEEKAFEVEMTLLKHENFLLVESIEMEHGRNGVRNHHVH